MQELCCTGLHSNPMYVYILISVTQGLHNTQTSTSKLKSIVKRDYSQSECTYHVSFSRYALGLVTFTLFHCDVHLFRLNWRVKKTKKVIAMAQHLYFHRIIYTLANGL